MLRTATTSLYFWSMGAAARSAHAWIRQCKWSPRVLWHFLSTEGLHVTADQLFYQRRESKSTQIYVKPCNSRFNSTSSRYSAIGIPRRPCGVIYTTEFVQTWTNCFPGLCRTCKDQISGFSRTQKHVFKDFPGYTPFTNTVAWGQKVHIPNQFSM